MSKQDDKPVCTLQRPTVNTVEAWKVYWTAQGFPWRTEPEIDAERQKYLAERLNIKPDIEQGIYSLKDIKLIRADVEWLLAMHESEGIIGPVNWNDKHQWKRQGLDLRGANLSQENLSGLPLARMQGGLTPNKRLNITEKQRNMAIARMEKVDFHGAQLQGADLSWAQLQGADFSWAQLQGADLHGAQLQKATFRGAEMQEADLEWAEMQEADLYKAQLQKASLGGAKLRGASLHSAKLQGVFLHIAQLDGVDLRVATLTDETYGPPLLADVRWGEINLAVVDWTSIKMLGDEHLARKTKNINHYQEAVRANRQLAVVLRDQGLNEEADHFAYRAQRLQRIVLWKQRKYGRYLFSGVLDLLAGYGYRPLRSVFWYSVTLLGFALTYFTFGHLSLWPPDAFIYSLTSFHGRGFFPGLEGKHSLHDPLIMFAAFEAVVGLFIEISFIATFTQRFFGK